MSDFEDQYPLHGIQDYLRTHFRCIQCERNLPTEPAVALLLKDLGNPALCEKCHDMRMRVCR